MNALFVTFAAAAMALLHAAALGQTKTATTTSTSSTTATASTTTSVRPPTHYVNPITGKLEACPLGARVPGAPPSPLCPAGVQTRTLSTTTPATASTAPSASTTQQTAQPKSATP